MLAKFSAGSNNARPKNSISATPMSLPAAGGEEFFRKIHRRVEIGPLNKAERYTLHPSF